jgi:hypothetical protein
MTQPTYYTVIIGIRSCMVKYAQSPDYSVKLFSQSFPGPDKAHETFRKTVSGQCVYLAERIFDHKVDFLSSRYRQDQAKLQAWNQGKPIRI